MKTFSAYVEWDPETKLYVGIAPGIPGAHTQGATLDELQTNLKEVLELCLQEYQGSWKTSRVSSDCNRSRLQFESAASGGFLFTTQNS
jgi:predicted RNase H-like HicB family nuclease